MAVIGQGTRMVETVGGGYVVGQPIDEVHTTARHTLGTRALDEFGNEYVYLKGVASVAQYDLVTYDPVDFSTAVVRLTKAQADKLLPIAVAQAAIVASSYGWFLVKGTGYINVLASCAKEVALYSSATAGSLDDDSTSQTKINRTVAHQTDGGSGGAVLATVNYPSAG